MPGYIKLKYGVLPRFFDCQPDRSFAKKPTARKVLEKLKQKTEINAILNDSRNETGNKEGEHLQNVPSENVASENIISLEIPMHENAQSRNNVDIAVKTDSDKTHTCNFVEIEHNYYETPTKRSTLSCLSPNIIRPKNVFNEKYVDKVECINKSIQCHIIAKENKHFRSKNTQCNLKAAGVNQSTSPIKVILTDTGCSPIKFPNASTVTGCSKHSSSTLSSTSNKTSSEYQPSSMDEVLEEKDLEIRMLKKKIINYNISQNAFFYLRIPEN